jgi:hypothetical protein
MPGIDARKTSSAAPASESANVVLLWLREGRGSYETDAAGIFPCRGNRPWTASSTQMSSSSSFQRKASPCRRSWTRSSWAWGALASKGYFVAGKLTSRSSDNSSQMRRSSTQQRRAAIGEGALLSMKRSIGVNQGLAMFHYEPLNFPQLGRSKAVVGGHRNRPQPKLRLDFVAFDVNVRRFVRFTAVKVKTIRTNAQHGRHARILSLCPKLSNLSKSGDQANRVHAIRESKPVL